MNKRCKVCDKVFNSETDEQEHRELWPEIEE